MKTMKTVEQQPRKRPAAAARQKVAAPLSLRAPLNTEERVHLIEALAKRVDEYVRFICQAVSTNGTSAETKERVVMAFYEQMVQVESQLGRIHDQFRLE